MTTWVLSLCIGVSWLGCGKTERYEFPSEESCYRAIAAMKTGDMPVAESDKKRSTTAVCAPKQ